MWSLLTSNGDREFIVGFLPCVLLFSHHMLILFPTRDVTCIWQKQEVDELKRYILAQGDIFPIENSFLISISLVLFLAKKLQCYCNVLVKIEIIGVVFFHSIIFRPRITSTCGKQQSADGHNVARINSCV